jgi:hypothetical protein
MVSSTVTTLISLTLLFLMISGALTSLIYIRKSGGFKWVQLLIGLVILTDLGETLFVIFYYLEGDLEFLISHPYLIAYGLGTACFFLYFNNFMVCWLYSLKQWRISIEVPRQLGNTSTFSIT